MKITLKERRKSNIYIVIALFIIFIVSIIFIRKYFELQKDYYRSLKNQTKESITEQNNGIIFGNTKTAN